MPETILVYHSVKAFNEATGRDEDWRESENSSHIPPGQYMMTVSFPAHPNVRVSMAIDKPGEDETVKIGAASGDEFPVNLGPDARGVYFGGVSHATQPFDLELSYR